MKKVYVGMAADIIHTGHINILNHAKKYGSITVGLLTDEAIASYKKIPLMKFEDRKAVIKSINGVDKVIAQKTHDYTENLESIKPDYVVHGDDWKHGIQKKIREKVINTIKKWEGKLIEIKYTKGISSSSIKEIIQKNVSSTYIRSNRLSRLIDSGTLIRILEVHNGLTALIAENVRYLKKEFDGMWLSSLTHSASKGKPDNEYIDDTTIVNTINDVFDCTTKPLILDADSGGKIEHFKYTITNMERLGVSALIIEDKVGNKKNSLFDKSVQKQDTVENFSNKIFQSKSYIKNSEMKIFARIESLIMNKSIDDAIGRAKAYIEAGADGIMIHSKSKVPKEILTFLKEYNEFVTRKPIIVVPTTYSSIKESELRAYGVNIVIYANHLIRSAYPAMAETAKLILKNERSKEIENKIMPIKEIINLVGDK